MCLALLLPLHALCAYLNAPNTKLLPFFTHSPHMLYIDLHTHPARDGLSA